MNIAKFLKFGKVQTVIYTSATSFSLFLSASFRFCQFLSFSISLRLFLSMFFRFCPFLYKSVRFCFFSVNFFPFCNFFICFCLFVIFVLYYPHMSRYYVPTLEQKGGKDKLVASVECSYLRSTSWQFRAETKDTCLLVEVRRGERNHY